MIAQAFQWDFIKPYRFLSCFQVKIFGFFPVFRLMLLNKIFLAYIWSRFLDDTCKILLRVLRLEVFMEFWISELTFEKDWKLRDRMWQTVWWRGNGIREGHERTEHALEIWSWLTWVGEWPMLGITRKKWTISDMYEWNTPEQNIVKALYMVGNVKDFPGLCDRRKSVWREYSSLSLKEK